MTFASDLFRKADGEGVQRRLRRGVIDVLARRAQDGRARGDVDDRPTAAAVPRRHAADALSRADERAGHVCREDAAEPRRIHALDARLALQDAGVVHQPQEGPELRIDGLEQADDVGLAGDVGLDGDRPAAQRPHLGDHRLSSGLVRAEVHADVVAALRRQARGRGADSTTRTGDEHDGHRVMTL